MPFTCDLIFIEVHTKNQVPSYPGSCLILVRVVIVMIVIVVDVKVKLTTESLKRSLTKQKVGEFEFSPLLGGSA